MHSDVPQEPPRYRLPTCRREEFLLVKVHFIEKMMDVGGVIKRS
jgi:hypothetical protein